MDQGNNNDEERVDDDDDGSGVVSAEDYDEAAEPHRRRRAAVANPATSLDQLRVSKCYEIMFDRFDDGGRLRRRYRPSAPRGSMDDDVDDDDDVRDEKNDDDDDESADFLKAYCDKNSLIFDML